jgi:predicted TPR repeat methyltransferase
MANKIDEEIETASAAIAQNPNDAGAYERLGDLHTSKGDHDSAAADYNKASELDASNKDIAEKRSHAMRNSIAPHTKGSR